MPLRRLSAVVLVAFCGFSTYAGTAAALDISPPGKSGVSKADVSAPTLSDAGSATESVTTPAASATVDTASAGATSSVDAVAAVTDAPVASSATSAPAALGEDPASPATLHVRVQVRTPPATVSAGLAVGPTGVSAVATATAPAVGDPVKVDAGLVHGLVKASKASAQANRGAGAGDSDAGTALPSGTPLPAVAAQVPSSGLAERPEDSAPGVATIRGLELREESSLVLPALSAGALDPQGLVGVSSAAPWAASVASPATIRTAPARPRPLPAPPESRAPFGVGGGAGPGIGFAATLFAALSALLLIVPHAGRRLWPVMGLAPRPAFAFLLERPG